MKRKRIKALLLALAMMLCAGCKDKTPAPDQPDTQGLAQVPTLEQDDTIDWEGTVVYDGTTYQRRTDLKTVLFLGVDDTRMAVTEGDVIGNIGRADAIALFILDTIQGTTQALVIPRDTITEVDVYTGNGDLAYSRPMHINLQYSYGNSPARGCFLTKRTVSELLYNTRIDGYLSMTMEGISAVVEELGGVTLTMPEDYTEIDARYTAGAEVTLNGAEAERFVRYRDITVHGSAETRTERQSLFAHTLFRQMQETGNMEETLDGILDAAGPYIEMDVEAETLSLLASNTFLEDTLKVPGSVEVGQYHDEYHVDEDALKEMVLRLFYEAVS